MDEAKFLEWLEYAIEESNVTEYIWALEDIRERVLKGQFDTTR